MGSAKADTVARWRLDSIEIENFRGVLGKQRFAFSGLPSLVFGENGVGKSTIAHALEWTLFGYFPSRVLAAPKPAFMSPVGSARKGCRVEIVFVRGADRLVVRRDDAEDTFVVEQGRRRIKGEDAESALEHALGLDADTFVRAVLLQQSRIRGLLLDEPKERNKALDRLLGMETAEALLETVKPKPFKDAAAAWRDNIEVTEARFEERQAVLKQQLDDATEVARAQRFLNKDLNAAGLKARYAELGRDLTRVGEKYGVAVTALAEVQGVKAAKKASVAVEKELQWIRVGAEVRKKLAPLEARLGTLEAAKQRFSAALSARDEAQQQLNKLVEKHGDAPTRSSRHEELIAGVTTHEEDLRSASEMRSLLTQARTVFAAKSPDNCPVCEQPVADSARVLRSLGQRIEALTTKRVRDIEGRLEEARKALAAHDVTTKAIDLAKAQLAERNAELDAGRRRTMKQLGVDGLVEKRVLPEIDKTFRRDEAECEKLRRGIETMEKELEAIADLDRALRDGLVPLLQAREALAALEADWKKAKAGYAAAEKQAQQLESTTTDIESIRKAILAAKDEIVSATLDRARPRAQALYKKLVQHRLFDQLQVKTALRANKVDYSFEVSSSDVAKSGREARLVLSDGQMTASALALFFALAESSQHGLDLLYVDDPTQNLDHPRKEAMAKVVADLATRRQIIVSTQDEDFVTLLCDAGFESGATIHNIVGWARSPEVRTAPAIVA